MPVGFALDLLVFDWGWKSPWGLSHTCTTVLLLTAKLRSCESIPTNLSDTIHCLHFPTASPCRGGTCSALCSSAQLSTEEQSAVTCSSSAASSMLLLLSGCWSSNTAQMQLLQSVAEKMRQLALSAVDMCDKMLNLLTSCFRYSPISWLSLHNCMCSYFFTEKAACSTKAWVGMVSTFLPLSVHKTVPVHCHSGIFHAPISVMSPAFTLSVCSRLQEWLSLFYSLPWTVKLLLFFDSFC